MSIRFLAAAVLACSLISSAVHAQPTTERRIHELEQKQKEMNEELRGLREQMEKETEAKKVEEVERRQGILTDEVRRLREALVLPESKELKSIYGLGPAASKVYQRDQGLSIGGYGEFNFKALIDDKQGEKNEFDFLRFVLYVGYKYNDWIVLNSEIEFEHATSSSSVSASDGSVSVEFATLDFLLHPMANARGGLVLVPVGFINEIHEPPFYFGNARPEVERQILPATWRSNGFGFFGELMPGLTYRTYGITSLNAEGFASSGIRNGRQSGNREVAEDWSWVGRLDYAFLPASLIGASAYIGDQGQDGVYDGEKRGAFMQMYELHAQVEMYGFHWRGLAAYTDLDDARALSVENEQTIADSMWGWYTEIAYDVMPWIIEDTTQYLAPWFRYSKVDTQHTIPSGFVRDKSQNRDIFEIGLAYKPIPQVVLKLDYRNQKNAANSDPDEVRIGAGFVF
jgi:opacity protein-like surface antigen